MYFVKNAESLRCKNGERESGKEGGLGRMKEVSRKKRERGHNVKEWKEICKERDGWKKVYRWEKRTNVLVQSKMERKNCRNIDKREANIFHEYNNSLH